MPLNRRIILNRKPMAEAASEIIIETPVEIAPPPPPRKDYGAFLHFEFEPKPSEPTVTFNDFFQMAGLAVKKDRIICMNCRRAAEFDADFDKKTIRCLKCDRIVSFAKFEKEQQ